MHVRCAYICIYIWIINNPYFQQTPFRIFVASILDTPLNVPRKQLEANGSYAGWSPADPTVEPCWFLSTLKTSQDRQHLGMGHNLTINHLFYRTQSARVLTHSHLNSKNGACSAGRSLGWATKASKRRAASDEEVWQVFSFGPKPRLVRSIHKVYKCIILVQ